MFGDANTILPLKDHANIIAELMFLCHSFGDQEFTTEDLHCAFEVYEWPMVASPTLTTNPPGKVLRPAWLQFYEHLPSYGDYIHSDITNTQL